MAQGGPDLPKRGKKFSKDYQPTPESKSKPKRITQFREAIDFFGQQLKSKTIIDGEDVELTFHANIAFKLMEMANKGDMKAIELITKVLPDALAVKKVETTLKLGADAEFED